MIAADGTIDGRESARSPRIVPDGRTFSYVLYEPPAGAPGQRITITQNDVRAIQLAKAALYAGVRLLMDELGVDHVDTIRLAGAFGSQIDVVHAMVLGLIPDCDLRHVSSAGNAAGTGALIALLSADARREIETVVRRVQKVETAVEPRFQEHFVDAMALPHRTAPSPNLPGWWSCPTRPSRAPAAAGTHDPRCPTEPTQPHRTGPTRIIRSPPPHPRSPDMTIEAPHRRSGGRDARRALRAHAVQAHDPFLTRTLAPYEVLGEEGLALLERNADTILQEVGIDFRGDPRGPRD